MGRTVTRNSSFLIILCIVSIILCLEFLLFIDTSEQNDRDTPISFNDNMPLIVMPQSLYAESKLDTTVISIASGDSTESGDDTNSKNNDTEQTQSYSSNINSCKHQNPNYNSHKFTVKELQNLMLQRRTAPIQICNKDEVEKRSKPQRKRLDITKFPNNMVPFVNRCKVNILSDNAEFTEVWINNQTGYNHVYKCGGTTIWNALDGMQKTGLMNGMGIKYKLDKNDSFIIHDNEYYWDHRKYFYNYLYNVFFFSYIRDPVDRFLSSYYELAVRETLNIQQTRNVSTLAKLRGLYGKLLSRKCYRLDQEALEKRKKVHVDDVWSVDPHIHPQMIHLLNSTLQWFPYDYVGDLTHFDVTFRMLLDEVSDAVHNNESVYDDWVQRARNRESGAYGKESVSDVVKREHLNDDDFRSICEIYWIDYLCLPFDVPTQCNLTDLFVRHYGDDLTYLDCYYL